MTEEKKVSRRGYVKYAGAGIVVVAGAAAGAYYATLPGPKPPTTTTATTEMTTPTTGLEKGIRLIDADIDWKQFSGEEILVPFFPAEPALDRIREDTPKFEELTGIKVNYDLLAEPELRQKVALDLTTRTGNYDMIWNSPYEYGLFKDAIEPLNAYMDDPKLCDKEWLDYRDFIPKFQSAHEDDEAGDIYGILWCAESNMIYYRKDKFDEMGLTVPETWDDVYETGKKLMNPPEWYGFSIRGLGYSATTLTVVNNFIYGWGGDYLNSDMSPAFNDPKIVEAFEFARKLYRDTCSPGAPSYDWPEVLLEVQQGRAMTAFEMTWAGPSAGWIKEQVAPEVYQNVYYALPPKGPTGISAPAYWAWGWGINKYSKHKGATWYFLQWLNSKEMQNKWHWDYGYPSRLSVFDTPEAKKELGSFDNWVPVMLECFELADKNKTPPKIPESVEIQEAIATAWNATISGSMDAKTALDIAADAVDKTMRKAGYY